MKHIVRALLFGLAAILFIACGESADEIVPATETGVGDLSPDKSLTVEFTQSTTLDDGLFEVSGLITIDGRVFAHNDSGNDTYLYELDVTDGKIIRTIDVHNATKIDWEDITQDDAYVYIGDIGNNLGSRKDLVIYKVSKEGLLSSSAIEAERISIAYADQTDYYYEPYTTPYDAEALIAFGDRLYIFTKDWADYTTSVYPVSKEPGSYVLEKLADGENRFDVMVTGAAYEPDTRSVVLIGYNNPYALSGLFKSELIILQDFSQDHFFSGVIESHTLTNGLTPNQIEAVDFDTEETLYIASEGTTGFFETSADLYTATIKGHF